MVLMLNGNSENRCARNIKNEKNVEIVSNSPAEGIAGCIRFAANKYNHLFVNPSCMGGGELSIATQKFDKCLFSHHNNTTLIKTISLYDTALDLTNISIKKRKEKYNE